MRRLAPGAIVASALLLAGCGGSSGDAAPQGLAGAPLELEDPGAVHVHGLGYAVPRKTLYVATHTGLFELPESATTPTRIGDNRQDTMGFTLVGPSLFLGSGHPDARADLPPLLGLIRSNDRGRSWTPVSLLGQADFHVLRVRGTRVYGFDSTNERLLASTDTGRTWSKRPTPEALLDLAVDPSDAEHLVASGASVLYRSQNGGRTWRAAASGVAGYLVWPRPRRLFLATREGAFLTARGANGPWRPRTALGAPVAALLAVGEKTLFAALHDGTIKQSDDGGVTWKVRASS